MKPPNSLELVQRICTALWWAEHGAVRSADIAADVQTRVRVVASPDLREPRWPIRAQAKERFR